MSRIGGAGLQKGAVSPSPSYTVGGSNAFGELFVCDLAVIHKSTITNPIAASTTLYLSAVAGPNATTTTPALAATGADFTRNVVATVTHGTSIVAMTVVVNGLDMHGKSITETLTVTATGTTKTVTGNVAFRIINSVQLTSGSNASANSVSLGSGTKFGLAFKTVCPSLVKEMSGGSVVTNGTLVAASSSANADTRGTYSPNSAPNGSTAYILWYLVDDSTDGIT